MRNFLNVINVKYMKQKKYRQHPCPLVMYSTEWAFELTGSQIHGQIFLGGLCPCCCRFLFLRLKFTCHAVPLDKNPSHVIHQKLTFFYKTHQDGRTKRTLLFRNLSVKNQFKTSGRHEILFLFRPTVTEPIAMDSFRTWAVITERKEWNRADGVEALENRTKIPY